MDFLTKIQPNVDSLSISLLMGILGIAITIFTVVYSFMEAAKQNRRQLHDEIVLLREKDPVKEADYLFAQDYLKRLKYTNISLLIIIVGSILNLIVYAIHMIILNYIWIWIIALGIESLLIIFCLFTLSVYIKQYYARFKNVK